jgi:hypothetical protein
MMKYIFFIFIFVCLANDLNSQEIKMQDMSFVRKNSVQFEIFGNGFLYSFNYERVILNDDKFKTTGQIGYSYLGMGGQVLPIIINELISFEKHHIEFGLGYTFATYLGNHFMFRAGYRFQKPNGRLVFRAGFTPWFGIGNNSSSKWSIVPWGGVGVGFCF